MTQPLTEAASLRALIVDDAYAMSFQTMGQYRSALLKAFDQKPQPLAEVTWPIYYVAHPDGSYSVADPQPTHGALASQPAGAVREPLMPTPQQYRDAHLYLREREADLGAGELDHLLSIFGIGIPARTQQENGQ